MRCVLLIFCSVVTFMCFTGTISACVSHLFPVSEMKLNMFIVNTGGEGSG